MDDFIIWLGISLFLVVVAIIVCAAYRVGYANGETAERLRWHEAEVDARLAEYDRETLSGGGWLTEIDVE